MNRYLIAAAVGLAASLSNSTAQAVEVIRWERLPLAVRLKVGQERVVFLERNVRVGVPFAIGDRLRIQSAAGTVYLLANEPIEPTRLQLQDAITGELILLDIVAEQPKNGQARLENLRIVEESSAQQRSKAERVSQAVSTIERDQQTPIPVMLTRYAAQNLFSPLRTVEPLTGVRRVNVASDLSLDLLAPSLPVDAHPLATWRLDDYWVTAVRLKNLTSAPVDLDPRLILGDFATATFQHSYLGPKGSSADTSVVYLTTRGHSLSQALLPTISPIDAAINVPAVNIPAQETRHEK